MKGIFQAYMLDGKKGFNVRFVTSAFPGFALWAYGRFFVAELGFRFLLGIP